MSSADTPKILLTGATGYIGGTILDHLLKSTSPALSSATITCLLRGADRAALLTSTYGSRVRPVLYKDLDDIDATIAAAAEHDIVINTTLGYHPTSGAALVRGLAKRKAATGRDVWMIHTSGTSNVGDRPITKKWIEPEGREFDDAKDDVYGYEKDREEREGLYHQRTAEMAVVDAGLELGVKTLVIMSPTIFGLGSGLFNKVSIQIPAYIRAVLKNQHGLVIGEGKGVWDHVHIQDLAELYVIAVKRIVENGGEGLPSGKKGIIFSGNGRHTWLEVAQGVADACYEEGKIPDRKVQSVTIPEAASTMLEGLVDEHMIELAIASNSRTVSSVGRSLGWKPTRGEEAWKGAFREDLKAELEKQK
ncbi:NAD(P)-binding protein [Hypomontagnella monticulosa]|nr:NAD(P)-binding protein [Hypomontagnella monticulosa]